MTVGHLRKSYFVILIELNMGVTTSEFTQCTAKYLEQFLRGLSECGVIGNYAIQFLEVSEFTSSEEAIIEKHINKLLSSLQILMKNLSSTFPLKYDCFLDAREETSLFSLQNSSAKEKDPSDLSVLSPEPRNENIISDKIRDTTGVDTFFRCQSGVDEVKGEVKTTTLPSDDHCYIEVVDADAHQTRIAAKECNDHIESVVTVHSSLRTNKFCTLNSKDSPHDHEYLREEYSTLESRLSEAENDFSLQSEESNLSQSDSGQDNRSSVPLIKAKRINILYNRETNKIVSGSSQTIYADIVKLGPNDLNGQHWCEFCEKEFPSAGSLKRHLMSSHPRVLWCHTCLKSVNSKSEMRKHTADHHGDLPNVCCVCGKSFKSQSSLQRHARVHEGCRGTACEICGQTFSRSEYHKEHMRTHTGERPFKCEVCKKKFSKSSNLATHMLVHKPPEEGHLCSLCLKVFRRQDKLKEHTMRHLKIKRFVCKLCRKAYSEKRDLTKHINKIHIPGNGKSTKTKS